MIGELAKEVYVASVVASYILLDYIAEMEAVFR